MITPIFALFLIIILEGYVVLSAELLALRQTIPYVGSSTDTVLIIIAAVLMPLAAGYYFGGRILFFSTLGSFIGALFSTLVMMSLFRVNHTVSLLFVLLLGLIFLLSKKKLSLQTISATLITAIALSVNSDYALGLLHIIKNNTYNTVMVTEENGTRRLYLNNDSSSLFTYDKRKHDYIEFIERLTIEPILHSNPPKDILVIGAGGFTFGYADVNNRYDFLDIDGSLQQSPKNIC